MVARSHKQRGMLRGGAADTTRTPCGIVHGISQGISRGQEADMRNHSVRDCLQYILLATMVLIVGSALTGCRISSIAASATDVSATASATGTLPSGPTGTIAGDVVAGPTCPVEQAENPCPPAVVKNREVDIHTHAG